MNEHQAHVYRSALKRLREGRILLNKNRKLTPEAVDAIMESLTILAHSRRRVRSRRVIATHLLGQPPRPFENN